MVPLDGTCDVPLATAANKFCWSHGRPTIRLTESKPLSHVTCAFVADIYICKFRKTARGKCPDCVSQVGSTTPPNDPSAKKHDCKYADNDECRNHLLGRAVMEGNLYHKHTVRDFRASAW